LVHLTLSLFGGEMNLRALRILRDLRGYNYGMEIDRPKNGTEVA
jgi:hypothetical protein